MPVRKVAEGLRIDEGSNTYTLPPARGGSRYKYIQFMVKTLASSGTAPSVTVSIEHGPDGNLWLEHTAGSSAALPELEVQDGDTTKMLGEHFRGVLTTAAGTDWAVVDVFEITKPF